MKLQPSCPKCRKFLNLPDDDKIICPDCKSEFRRLGAAWDFRDIADDRENPDWDAAAFDLSYENTLEGFEDGLIHAAKQGIPEFLERYRMSQVKDKIAPWIVSYNKTGDHYGKNGTDDQSPITDNFPRILDLGCGHGWYGCYLVEKFDFQGELFGVDVSPFNINAYIKALKERNIHNIHPYVATAEALPFADGFFDVVFSSEVLEHVHSPGKFFQEASRVLKSGGEFIITTPSGPMCRFWNGLAWLPQKIKHIVTGRRDSEDNAKIYDIPMSWRVIRRHAKNAGFRVKNYTKSVFLPHESYLQFFPRPLQYMLLWNARLLGALKPFTTYLGLHHIIRLEKAE